MRNFFCWLILGILGFTLFTVWTDQASQNISYSPKLATAECRIIKHTMGETCVAVSPQRVVTLSLSTLGNVFAHSSQQAWNYYYQRIQELKAALSDRYQNKKVSYVYVEDSNRPIFISKHAQTHAIRLQILPPFI